MKEYQPPYSKSRTVLFSQVEVNDPFWSSIQRTNTEIAIFHQYTQLEKSSTIDNFRIVAKAKDGFREGYFYTDSDAHKWAEAAANILERKINLELEELLDSFFTLVENAQDNDGYIFTYNQFHFPNKRWLNFQIEHELYVIGHLIEAVIAYHALTKKDNILKIGIKAADLLVDRFKSLSSSETPGHEEIEIALIKLYRITKNSDYLELAEKFIEKRGKSRFFFLKLTKAKHSVKKRSEIVAEQRRRYFSNKSDKIDKKINDLSSNVSRVSKTRFYISKLTGKYFQQHSPIRKMKKPEGHSVRFGYFATAAAMLYQENGDRSLLNTLEKLWDSMVQKRMYITGGIGSLPIIEGFGKDYELDNKSAYCETCATISSIMWSFEMLLNTEDAKYADLIEWQLYNAFNVGMSLDGKTYFYLNPLETDGNLERKEWYKTACCPSNISRILAKLGRLIYSYNESSLWIHQYIGNETIITVDEKKKKRISCKMETEIPYYGKTNISVSFEGLQEKNLYLRIPSWTSNPSIKVNDRIIEIEPQLNKDEQTASGYSPYKSYYIKISDELVETNELDINFPVSVKMNHPHQKVKTNRNKIAISRGPIVYCFESIDNPSACIPNVTIKNNSSLETKMNNLIEGLPFIKVQDSNDRALLAIPYFLWGNRGKSSMQVWVNFIKKEEKNLVK